ncbi:hypothetical protein EUTSA_v10002921mg [Eutrema salsugineum]|uniref:Histone deacetylase interacting domain-containing protein n=1 Tax=Eutrema salsugineum TaxID=72664 RepID=V4L4P5_EUTSA|nr:hypothetical protein EUTSA_v10002921mg [Eutrema salsugineum]
MENDNDELSKIITLGKFVSERMNPLELKSLIEDFDKQKITRSEFRKSVQLSFAKRGQEEDVEYSELEEGEIQQDPKGYLAIRAKVDGNSKEQPTTQIRVKEHDVSHKREREKHVTNEFNSEGKKRRILETDTNERSLKGTRTSKRLDGRVTPSYRLIPEEEQVCTFSDTVLNNNKCCLVRFDDASGDSKLTDYQEAMARCEDDMFEADMLMEALKSAVDRAEKVMSGEMTMEDLGVKFYRCIEMLYRGDMSEIVREDHKKALPVILPRLKQQLDKLMVAREKWKPGWKQVLEENTAKQRGSTAQGHKKR